MFNGAQAHKPYTCVLSRDRSSKRVQMTRRLVTIPVLKEFLKSNWPDNDSYVVLNVYLFGSRLYGVAKETSDYDFIVIVAGPYFPGPVLLEVDDINANIFHFDYWKTLLDDNVPWMMMLNWLPKEYELL